MKKRIISIALVVVMIVAMIPAMLLTTSATQYYDGFDSPIVSNGAITVDASATPDAVYLTGEQIVPVSFKNGTTSYFRGYTAADQNGFYIWFNVTDPTTDKATGYEKEDPNTGDYNTIVKGVNGGDYFQLYIRATTLTAKQVASLTFDYLDGGRVIADGGIKGSIKVDMVDCAATLVDGGWILEAYVPFAALASDGNEIFDGATVEDVNVSIGIQVTDYVNTTEANTQTDYCYSHQKGGSFYRGIYANHTSADSDLNGGYAGTRFTPLNFSGFHTNVTADTINVDGKMDAAYAKSDLIKSSTAWGATGSFNAYTVATLDGLYVWAEILDTTLTKKEFERIDLGDKFQLYYQMGTKTSARDWGYIEIDYRDYRYNAADYENDVLKDGIEPIPAFNVTNKTGATFSDGKGITNASCEYATTKMYNADGSDKGWTAEIFVPWTGEAAINNISSLDDIFCSVGIQVNDYAVKDAASTPSTYADSYTKQGLSYSDRDGGRYYYAWNNKDGSGHYYFTNLIFEFDEDTPDLLNKKWAAYTDSITFDGVKDAAYSEYTRQPVDWVYSQTDGKGWVTDGSINLADTYYAFTDDAVYVFVDVYDTTGYTSHSNEYVSIYWSVSDYMGKFNLRSDKTQGSKGTYEGVGRNYTLLEDDKSNIDVANLALTYKGDPAKTDEYTGYCVEFKIDLPEPERLALQQGKSIAVNVGVEINDAGIQQTSGNTGRTYYGFSAPCGGGWWIGMNYNWTYTSGGWGGPIMPRVILDKDLSLDLFDVENPFKINSANVALGESINVNYYVNLPANATNAKMRFTMNDKVTYANARKTETVGEYKFVFAGVAPQCMGDNIVAELIVDGEVVDTLADYSVYQNCMNIVLKDLENEALVALVGDLGAYGAAAQQYANYKTDDLVNEGYEHFATVVETITNNDKTNTGSVDGAAFIAAGVYFDSTNRVYVKVEVTDPAALEFLSVTIDGEAAVMEATDDENVYIVYTKSLLVTEFDNVFTFELTDGVSSQTVTYSVNAYCKAKLNATNPATAALAAATYAYGASAEAYIA